MTSSDDRLSSPNNNSDSLSDSLLDNEPLKELLDALLDEDGESDNSSLRTENLEQNHNFEYPDLEVEVEEEDQKDITLAKAVEYAAFLRQTSDYAQEQSVAIERSEPTTIKQYEELLDLETESASTEELADAVNTLIPLMVEMLKYKIDTSQESILRGVTPVAERIIEQRTLEEPQKMAVAISKILPAAITEKINLSPEEIAKAIAPELALSIKEQIRLDENAISEALGSEMGKAIKTQIEVEKDAMVDALYPVIGDTISKYMVEVVKEINSKVENTLSSEGLKRKLRARIQGISEAELILQESVGCRVQAVLLIDKDSGLIIQQVQQQHSVQQKLDGDMLAGMLTAIRSFANDCIVSGSELDSIDYGNWQIHLEVAGYCYLAVILQGEPSNNFLARIRRTLGQIILNHGDTIAQFEGDMETVPAEIKSDLEELIKPPAENERKSSFSKTFLWLLIFLIALILIPWGMVNYRSRTANHIEQITAVQLDAAPELSVYRLEPRVRQGELILEGRVPSEYLRIQAENLSQEIAEENNLKLNNQIITVRVPVNPNLLAGEIARLTQLFNQQPGVAISTNYQPGNLSIKGFILDLNQQEDIINAFSRIPGIQRTTVKIANQLPTLEERIYFDSAATKFNFPDNARKIESIINFLNRYPQLNLKLIAYNDRVGSKQINRKLGIQRCSNLKNVLIAEGADSARLISDCETNRIFTQKSDRSIRLTRYVEFEPFIPKKYSR